MENASKALLIAGGVLLGILVVSLLMYTLNQISNYQSSSSNIEKNSQMADFNSQFTQYSRNNLKGNDLITLFNKVVDYNVKEISADPVDLEEKITITINMEPSNGDPDFETKHTATRLFETVPYPDFEVVDNNSEMMQTINQLRREEENFGGVNTWTILSSNNESLKSGSVYLKNIVGKGIADALQNSFGSNLTNVIEKHSEYSNFKSSKFMAVGAVEYYDDGQIRGMSFEFVE